MAVDGDEYLRGSEQFCGKGVIQRKSLFRSVVFAYTSGGSWGSFRCQLYAAPQPCDCGWSVNTKIVNGQETGINEYPGVVALKTSEAAPPFCSATISMRLKRERGREFRIFIKLNLFFSFPLLPADGGPLYRIGAQSRKLYHQGWRSQFGNL